MKKTMYKILARMARDGDAEAAEALAEAMPEVIEALTEPEVLVAPAEAPAVAAVAAEPAAEPVAVAAAAAEPQEPVPVLDCSGEAVAAILAKLDQLIALLTPAAAGDEDPAEPAADPAIAEIVEAVAEAVEAGAAAEAPADPVTEEVAQIVEEILEPSAVIEPVTDEDCGDPDKPVPTADALRAALVPLRPALSKLPADQRRKVCGDIAARLRQKPAASASSGIYAALASRARDAAATADPASVGRRIMASRNPHFKP